MVDIADEIERMGASMASFVANSSPDALMWRAEVGGGGTTRTMLELVAECVATNRAFAFILGGGLLEPGDRPRFDVELPDAATAISEIKASAVELSAALRALPAESGSSEFVTWRGPIRADRIAIGAFRNMAYHAGQINFIQILLGDSEFHVPDTWY